MLSCILLDQKLWMKMSSGGSNPCTLKFFLFTAGHKRYQSLTLTRNLQVEAFHGAKCNVVTRVLWCEQSQALWEDLAPKFFSDIKSIFSLNKVMLQTTKILTRKGPEENVKNESQTAENFNYPNSCRFKLVKEQTNKVKKFTYRIE